MMEQHHIIKRQVLHVGLESEIGSFLFQGELRDIYYAEIVPLLERCCNEISDSSEVYKINKLEIDLGKIDRNNLVEEFKSKILKQFYEGLSQAIREMPSKEEIKLRDHLATESEAYPGETDEDARIHYKTAPDESELELLSHFLKTGRLPWWKGKNDKIDLHLMMDRQLEKADSEFIGLLEMLVRVPAFADRLIYQFSADQLERVVEVLSKADRESIRQGFKNLSYRLEELSALKKTPGKTIQKLPGLFQRNPDQAESFEKGAKIGSVDAENDVAPGKHSISSGSGETGEAYALTIANQVSQLKRLLKEVSALISHKDSSAFVSKQNLIVFESSGEILFELLQILKSIRDRQTGISEVLNSDKPTDRQIKHRLVTAVITIPEKLLLLDRCVQSLIREELALAESTPGRTVKARLETILTLVSDLIDNGLSKPKRKGYRFEFDSKHGDRVRKATEGREIENPRPKSHSDLFAESQELYISNAGLVLFWPYLGRFFTSAGSLDKNRFINKTKQEHSVLSLQYLAQGHQGFNEYDLTLNKIICGLDPNDPVPTVVQLDDKEIEEAETLVSTLIQHWSVLKNMSPGRFRQMFLNREGMISTRDGNYVLRVEEQAYDVLIDKMPWQITTVKLPWMENLIFVEWRL